MNKSLRRAAGQAGAAEALAIGTDRRNPNRVSRIGSGFGFLLRPEMATMPGEEKRNGLR